MERHNPLFAGPKLPAMVRSTPLLGPIAGAMVQAVQDAKGALDLGDLSRLNHEVQRQELSLRMAELQARVAQELAIAQRIETAEEVAIEEYYEAGGEGSFGFRPGPGGGVVGIAGGGRKVTKRVFRFIGTRAADAA